MTNNDNITGTGVNKLNNSNNKETTMEPNKEVICEVCNKHVKEENTYYAECEATICVNCWDTHVLQCPRCTEAVEQERKESAEDQAWANLHMGEKPEPEVEPEQEVLTQAPKEAPKMDTKYTLATTQFTFKTPAGPIKVEAYSYSQAAMVLGCDYTNYVAQLVAKGVLTYVGAGEKSADNARIINFVMADDVERYKLTYKPRDAADDGMGTHSYEIKMAPEDVTTIKSILRKLTTNGVETDKAKFGGLLKAIQEMQDLTLQRRVYAQKHNAMKKNKKQLKKATTIHTVENVSQIK